MQLRIMHICVIAYCIIGGFFLEIEGIGIFAVVEIRRFLCFGGNCFAEKVLFSVNARGNERKQAREPAMLIPRRMTEQCAQQNRTNLCGGDL
jgi:hypothetical protein